MIVLRELGPTSLISCMWGARLVSTVTQVFLCGYEDSTGRVLLWLAEACPRQSQREDEDEGTRRWWDITATGSWWKSTEGFRDLAESSPRHISSEEGPPTKD